MKNKPEQTDKGQEQSPVRERKPKSRKVTQNNRLTKRIPGISNRPMIITIGEDQNFHIRESSL